MRGKTNYGDCPLFRGNFTSGATYAPPAGWGSISSSYIDVEFVEVLDVVSKATGGAWFSCFASFKRRVMWGTANAARIAISMMGYMHPSISSGIPHLLSRACIPISLPQRLKSAAKWPAFARVIL